MPKTKLKERLSHLLEGVVKIFNRKSKHSPRKLNKRILAAVIMMALITQLTIPVFGLAPNGLIGTAEAASTYYVSPSGNDSNPGTQASPFRTIQKGVNTAQAGDTVLVRGGTYNEAVNVNRGGITIANYPNETPVLDGQNSRGTGFNFGGAPNVTIKGFTVRNFNEHGVYNANSSAHNLRVEKSTFRNIGNSTNHDAIAVRYNNNFVLADSLIEDIGGRGFNGWRAGNNYQFIRNTIRHTRADGIYISPTSPSTSTIFDGNHIYNIGIARNGSKWIFGSDHVDLIQAQPDPGDHSGLVMRNNKFGRVDMHQVITKNYRNAQFYNNVWYGGFTDTYQGHSLRMENMTGALIYNNTFAQIPSGRAAFVLGTSNSSARAHNNIVQGGSGQLKEGNGSITSQSHNFIGNPGFVNPGAGDFHLASNATGAIDKGTNSPSGISLPSTDHNGKARIVNGTVDIGAYEYGSTTPAPAPTPTPTEPNIALKKPVTASIYSTTRVPENAVDGDAATFWAVSATQGLPQHLIIDLQKVYDLNKVRMLSPTDTYAKAYKVSVSTDGNDFKEVYATTTGKGGLEEMAVSGQGRYVRLDVTAKSDTPYGFGVHEFEVYGKEAPQDTTPPKVAITEPVNNATVGGQVNIKTSASDDKGIQKVEFYIDGAIKKAVSASPYEYTWDSTTVSDGTHKILAKAYDTSGNTASTEVTVNVKNSNTNITPPPMPDITAPVTVISDPAEDSTLTGDKKLIKGITTDDVAVAKVEVAVQKEDGSYWTGSDWSTTPYWLPADITSGAGTKNVTWTYLWQMPQSDNIAYKIKARGIDTSGNVENTAYIEVQVDNVAPSGNISINSGAESATEKTVTVTNSITGASKMRFSVDGSTWTDWENYAGSKTLALTGNPGLKTVKGQFSDGFNIYETSDSIKLEAATVNLPITYPAGWNMVAASETDMGTTLYTYDSADEAYVKADSPVAGMGYWAFYDKPTTITVTLKATDRFDVKLQPGWNMVGNPFDRDIAVPSKHKAYTYDSSTGDYKVTDRIPKGRSVWVMVPDTQTLTLNR